MQGGGGGGGDVHAVSEGGTIRIIPLVLGEVNERGKEIKGGVKKTQQNSNKNYLT